VHGDNEARFNQSYSNLAMEVGLSPELNGENLLWAVKHWLEQQSSWLVVIDNADELSIYKAAYSDRLNHDKKLGKWDLFQYIPQPQRNSCGAILWTSRDGAILSRIVGPNRGLELGTMTMQESWMLFQKMLGTLNDKTPPRADEEQLMVLLGGLPLAIAQAAAYIRNTKISSSRYISLFRQSEDKQSKLLEYEFDDPYRLDVPNSVMQTWSISVQQASQEYGVARLILNTIAFLDHQGLPFEILQAAAGPDASEDEVLLVASRLTEYSLLQAQQSIDDELPTYEQHRLMQVATRNSLSEVDISWTSGKALEIADHLFPSGEFETWTACKRYLPHALKASSWKRAVNHKEHAIRLLGRMGMYYLYQGRSDEAEKLEVEVLELSKNVLREKHPDTILAMANLAATWWQQGRSDKAEKLQVEVLELRKKVLGEKHPDTVTAMANLAVTWQQQGRSDEAEKLKVKVLELQKNVLGERHPETIRAMASLAATWWQQGRSDKAEKLLVEVLNLRKNVLGEKHPDTIKAMANLSSTWWQQGRSDKAEKLQVEVLELSKNVLGEKHPDTITAMAKLASTWWQQGHLDEAEKLQVEVLEQRKDVQGEKHPDTIKAMASLAATWWQQGRSDKAEKLEVEVLELRKNVLGERHPETIRAMANLAATWWQQGRSDEAEKLKVEVLELRKKVLGEKHPDTIKAMANLAST
jgi:tetratricopeptide (TPR) repeat protein